MKRALILLMTLAASLPAQERAARTDRGSTATKNVATPRPAAAEPVSAAANDVPGQMAAEFFSALQRGQIDDAYATLTKGSKTIEKPEDLRILKQKTKEAVDAFGAIIGHEVVETRMIGTKLMRRTYLSLGDEYPLRWRFYFYEAKGRWRLIDLRVDDRLTGMFEEPKDADDTRDR
jgi:hypothetical protein